MDKDTIKVLDEYCYKLKLCTCGKEPKLISGSQEERLEQIIKQYNLPVVVPIKEAVARAKTIISSNRESVSRKIIEQYNEPTLKEKIKFITEF